MIDILFAIIGAGAFVAFCTVLIVFVPHTDLVIVILLVIAMVCYDFFLELWRRRKDDG